MLPWGLYPLEHIATDRASPAPLRLVERGRPISICRPTAYVSLPGVEGDKAGRTCFVTRGVPSAVARRDGGEITDVDASFLSIGV